VIPHASMAQRRFCLLPAAEVAPGAVVPTYGRTVTQLLNACEDPLEVIAL
jgi:2-amino-4-hydroxy-6-hydroxymethyldihydropteridine diphosphokinase